MRRREGVRLGDVLSEIGARLDKRAKGALSQSRVVRAWEEVAGPKVLEHTTGAHFRDGELVVYVDSPAWATELSALSESYREAMTAETGEEVARGVRFAVSNRVERFRRHTAEEEERERHYQPDMTESVPLTEQERAQVEASAAAITDDELREAVVKATVADLEWKKGIAAAKRRQEPRESV